MKMQKIWQKSPYTGLPLYLEISIFLCIKLLALFVLWKLFFSHPQTKKMSLPTSSVEQRLLSPSAPVPAASPSGASASLSAASHSEPIKPQGQ